MRSLEEVWGMSCRHVHFCVQPSAPAGEKASLADSWNLRRENLVERHRGFEKFSEIFQFFSEIFRLRSLGRNGQKCWEMLGTSGGTVPPSSITLLPSENNTTKHKHFDGIVLGLGGVKKLLSSICVSRPLFSCKDEENIKAKPPEESRDNSRKLLFMFFVCLFGGLFSFLRNVGSFEATQDKNGKSSIFGDGKSAMIFWVLGTGFNHACSGNALRNNLVSLDKPKKVTNKRQTDVEPSQALSYQTRKISGCGKYQLAKEPRIKKWGYVGKGCHQACQLQSVTWVHSMQDVTWGICIMARTCLRALFQNAWEALPRWGATATCCNRCMTSYERGHKRTSCSTITRGAVSWQERISLLILILIQGETTCPPPPRFLHPKPLEVQGWRGGGGIKFGLPFKLLDIVWIVAAQRSACVDAQTNPPGQCKTSRSPKACTANQERKNSPKRKFH